VKIAAFLWDDHNVEHIAIHRVEPEEVEEVFMRRPKIRLARDDRYQASGTTEGGREPMVIFRTLGGGVIRPITARDMNAQERRTYYGVRNLGYIPPDPFVRGEGSRACREQRKRGALPAGPTERGGPPPLSNSPRGLCGLLWPVV
jgi:hypothetical protein